MPNITEPASAEQALCRWLRNKSVAAIQASDVQTVAARLGIRPAGVEALLRRLEWPLSTAVRVAEALGVIGPKFVNRFQTELYQRTGHGG